MELSPTQEQQIIAALSEPETLARIDSLWTDETGSDFEAREEWEARQNDSFDTSGARFRIEHLQLVDDALRRHMGRRDQQLSPLVKATDAYLLTDRAEPVRELPPLVETPLLAVKIFQTVFTFSFAERSWSSRPWLGYQRGSARIDPLLRLPYTRKYDTERVEIAERAEQRQWEALQRAADIVGIVMQRVERTDLRANDGRWRWPELDDAQDELADDDLTFAIDDLGLFAGRLTLELSRLDQHRRLPDGTRIAVGHPLAEGSYTGILAQHRFPSGASYKRMVLAALDELQAALGEQLHPLDDEQRAEREDLVEQLRNLEPVDTIRSSD